MKKRIITDRPSQTINDRIFHWGKYFLQKLLPLKPKKASNLAEVKQSKDIRLLFCNDPVLWFLMQRLKLPGAIIPVVAVVVHFVFTFGLGSIVSYAVHQGDNFVRVFDPDIVYYLIIQIFVTSPLLWLMYVRQSIVIATAVKSLYRNNIIACSNKKQLYSHLDKLSARIDSRLVFALSVMSSLIFVLFNVLSILHARQTNSGQENFIFHDKYFFAMVYIPLLFLWVYVGSTLIWKSIVTAFVFHNLFRCFEVYIHPLNPDRAGGLGKVGRLSINHGLIAVVFAEIVSLAAARIIIGIGWQWRDLIIFCVLYLFITPLIVVVPVWTAHTRMVQARDQLLQDISIKFEKTLVQQGHKSIKASNDQSESLDGLKKKYDLVIETYPTWPISFNTFRNFSLTSLLPIVTAIVTVLVDILRK